MPSRKKAKQRARRAKQNKRAAEIAWENYAVNEMLSKAEAGFAYCDHMASIDGCTNDDWRACLDLSDEMKSKLNDIYQSYKAGGCYYSELWPMIEEIYDKYHLFSEGGKKLFREMMLSEGTEECAIAAILKDLVKENGFGGVMPYVWMIKTMEVRDKYNGAFDSKIFMEIYVGHTSMNDMFACPRETVRFFHRRNSCACLREIYYKLKENTKRTASCSSCKKVRDIKTMLQCECKMEQYCSMDCANAEWPKHKANCKHYKSLQEW